MDADAKYRATIDELVLSCHEGQGPIAARGEAADAFVAGVHETLRVLHGAGIAPFDRAYEGTPFHDFVARLQGWTWPDGDRW